MKIFNKILDFFNQYYDKVLLGAILLVLSCVLLVQTQSLNKTREKVRDADRDLNTSTMMIEAVEPSQFESKIDLEKSVIWEKPFGEGSLVDPGDYVYSGDGSPYILHSTTLKNPYTGAMQSMENITSSSTKSDDIRDNSDIDGDKIPDNIEERHGLNKHDPNDALSDKDRDGFSNREEFLQKTDISDSKSRPKLVNRLRFLKKNRTELEITLKKVNMNNDPEDKKSWDIMINYKSGNRWKSDFLKIGATIPEHNYKIIDAEYHEIIQGGIPVEQSKITIEKENQDPITLLRNRNTFTGEESYELLYFFGDKPLKITTKLNKEFPLDDLKGKREIYKLAEENEAGLFAELIETGERFEISRYSASDKAMFLKSAK